MPSLDVVSRIDMQEVDNAVNNTLKEVATRYDFKGVKTEVTLDKKDKKINMLTGDKMKMEALREMFSNKAAKRSLDLRAFEFADPQPTSQGALKREVKIKEGLEKEVAQKIVKHVKAMKVKVQPSIQGDEVRLTGKQIDDLQRVMGELKQENFGLPLQFVNMQR